MPRPATRRPAPIVLPNQPMDTLWEVDESSNDLTPSQSNYTSRSRVPSAAWSIPSPPRDQLRSVFEDDDDEDVRNVAFPLPPVSLPRPVKRLFSVPRMMLPIHPAPRSTSAPSSPSSSKRTVLSAPPRKSSLSPNRPSLGPRSASLPFPRDRSVSPQCTSLPATPRRRSDVQRPVSPTSSASSSDNELPRTPTSSTSSLPIPPVVSKPYVLAPPPPAEWESAIDALFAEYDYEEDLPSPVKVAPIPIPTRRAPPMPTRRAPSPPVSSPQRESYMSWSPLSGSPASPRRSFGSGLALPMSPTFERALGSPGFMPTSPGGSDSDHFFSSFTPRTSVVVPSRPARRREGRVPSIPVEFLYQAA